MNKRWWIARWRCWSGAWNPVDAPRTTAAVSEGANARGAQLSLYTIEVKRRPLLTFVADTMREAEEMRDGLMLRENLVALEHGGQPLWDGKASISVRRAKPEEDAAWQTAFVKARDRGEVEDGEGYAAFLIKVKAIEA